jgi:fluoride exporter
MTRFFWVFAAGGIGSVTRYLVGLWAADRLGPSFPYGTLIVNLSGCLLIGAVWQAAAAQSWHPDVRIAVIAGFLGGFTTYSAFNQETLLLLQSGAAGAALVNIGVTLVGGLAAGWLGLVVARQLIG